MTEAEGAVAEAQCSAPPGWFLPDDDSSSDMQECPSGTYKEVRAAAVSAAAAAAALAISYPHVLNFSQVMDGSSLSHLRCRNCCIKTQLKLSFGARVTAKTSLACVLPVLCLCRVGTVQPAAHHAAQASGYQKEQNTLTFWTPILAAPPQ
jgi:hypothetical protein